jgi:hypothetical protein
VCVCLRESAIGPGPPEADSEAPLGAQVQVTALFRAAENGHVETARLLLEKGAAVDARSKVVATGTIRSWLQLSSVPPSMIS